MLDDARTKRVCLVFGARIRELRHERGLTQSEVAERAGVSLKYVSQIERGSRNPTLGVLLQLGRALDVMPERLVEDLDRVV